MLIGFYRLRSQTCDDRFNIPTVDTTLVPALGKVVVREARSGERFSFAT